jgi:hypothetical protein
MSKTLSLLTLATAVAVTGTGCASWRARSADATADCASVSWENAEPQVVRGRPNRFVDGVGWVWGIPEKVLLWDRRALNHEVSPETEQKLVEYVAANGLQSTKVRVNQYDPGGEWRRLAANKDVGAGWRYTFGALRALGYTIFPGRVFGDDNYNPYTDTVSIYSDIPALALEQGGHAKNVKGRPQPGTYASVFSLPVLSLFPEKQAKDYALDYIAWEGTPVDEAAAVKVLYPQYGIEVGRSATAMLPGAGALVTIAAAGVGHAVGYYDAPKRANGVMKMQQARHDATPAQGAGRVITASALEPVATVPSAIDPAAGLMR